MFANVRKFVCSSTHMQGDAQDFHNLLFLSMTEISTEWHRNRWNSTPVTQRASSLRSCQVGRDLARVLTTFLLSGETSRPIFLRSESFHYFTPVSTFVNLKGVAERHVFPKEHQAFFLQNWKRSLAFTPPF